MNLKTPRQIRTWLDSHMHQLDTPEAYLGTEVNTWHWSDEQWNAAKFRTVLLAPFDYLQGMGNTTLPLLYQNANQFNSETWVTERCYSPTSQRESKIFEKSGIPMWSLETQHAIGAFDLIAFTLSYPGYLFNIVRSLRVSGIPVRARDRVDMREKFPLIMTGGHMYAGPWVTAPIVDIIWCGESEDESSDQVASAPVIRDDKTPMLGVGSQLTKKFGALSDNPGYNAVITDLERYKEKGWYYDKDGREEMLHELAVKYQFLFIPRFYTVHHGKAGEAALEGVYNPVPLPDSAFSHKLYGNRAAFGTDGGGNEEHNSTCMGIPVTNTKTHTRWKSDAELLPETGWRILGFTKKYSDLPDRVRKRFVRNLNTAPALVKPIVPFNDPSWVGTVQIARGCSYHCGFSVTSSARLFVHGVGIVPITEVRAGQVVSTDLLPKPVDDFIEEGLLPAKRIVLRNGLHIEASPSHRFRVIDNEGFYSWLHADELRPGHKIPVQYGMNAWGPYQQLPYVNPPDSLVGRTVEVSTYRSGRNVVSGVVRANGLGTYSPSQLPRQPDVLDERLAFLLGSWMGDGSIHKNGRTLMWTGNESDMIRVASCINELFGLAVKVRPDKRSRIKLWWVEAHSKHLVKYFAEALGIKWPKSEHVPELIFRSPRNVVESFLEGWWHADGYIADIASGHVDYLTNDDRKCLQDVALLLLNLGYKPYLQTIRYYGQKNERLGISNKALYRLHRNVNDQLRWKRSEKVPVPPVPVYDCSEVEGYDYGFSNDQVLTYVETVEDAPPQSMYDISLQEHTFVTNGFVSHNCAASYREAPYRERDQQVMVDAFREARTNSGTDEVSPLVLEFGTYSRKKALMKQVLEEVTDEFSMPSLRIDVFGRDPVFGQIAVHAQKKNITIAVEGNSQKMREVISKGITEDDVLKSLANAIAAGYESAKLYMICDLPGETYSDVEEIVELCRKIDQMRRSVGSNIRIRLSWKPLTIQANTPMQWFKARDWNTSIGDAMREIQAFGFGTQLGDEVRSALGNFLQLAELADDVVGEALCDTMIEADCLTFGTLPRRVYDILADKLADYGRTFEDVYRRRSEDEMLAWDVIDTRVSKLYLLRHYQAIVRRASDDPDQHIYGSGFLEKFGGCQIGCAQCGACVDGHDEDNKMFEQMEELAGRMDDPVRLPMIKKMDWKSQNQRLLLTCTIDSKMRYPTRKYWTYVLRRACYQENLRVATDSVKFATERIKTSRPWFAGREYVEVAFVQPVELLGNSSIIHRLNPHLEPFGFRIDYVMPIHGTASPMKKQLAAFLWELEIDQDRRTIEQHVREALARPYTKMVYKVEKYRVGEVNETINLRDVLHDSWAVVDRSKIKLMILCDPLFSPYDIANAIIGTRSDVYRYPALLQVAFDQMSPKQMNALHTKCGMCGDPIPLEFDNHMSSAYCHRCYYSNMSDRRRELGVVEVS